MYALSRIEIIQRAEEITAETFLRIATEEPIDSAGLRVLEREVNGANFAFGVMRSLLNLDPESQVGDLFIKGLARKLCDE